MNEAIDLLPESSEEQAERVACKPFLKWAGGKTNLLAQLLPRIPFKFSRYYEPFLGGGALLFRLQPRVAIAFDSNPELINVFRVVKESVEELIAELRPYVYEREYFYRVRNIDRTDEFSSLSRVQRAARFIYLNRTCFNGLYRVNSKGKFNVPFGKYQNPLILDEANLRACSRALRPVVLRNTAFAEVLSDVLPDDFVYFDPPYFPISTTSSFAQYTGDGFDAQMHTHLVSVCKELDQRGVRFMVSNSDCPFIRTLYLGFRVEEVDAPRAINSKGEKRGVVTELVIRNY